MILLPFPDCVKDTGAFFFCASRIDVFVGVISVGVSHVT